MNKLKREESIFFDFDGVIADSFKVAFDVHKSVFTDMTENDYRQILEGNVNDWNWSERLAATGYKGSYNFFDHYLPKMREEVKLFDGMDGVIKNLAQEYNLFIISSSITHAIQEFLEKYDLADYFIEIMGNDVHHSKVEKMNTIFSKYDIEPSHCVFVADTLGDIREAEQADVGAIGVTWGFNKREQLEKGKYFRIVEQPIDIQLAIVDYFHDPSSR